MGKSLDETLRLSAIRLATPFVGHARSTPVHIDLSFAHFVRHVPRLALISVRQLWAITGAHRKFAYDESW